MAEFSGYCMLFTIFRSYVPPLVVFPPFVTFIFEFKGDNFPARTVPRLCAVSVEQLQFSENKQNDDCSLIALLFSWRHFKPSVIVDKDEDDEEK